MYRPLALYIGLRYTRARKQQQLISFVSVISTLGIALGVMALILVLSVINASTSTMRDETLKLVPHASITPLLAENGADQRLDEVRRATSELLQSQSGVSGAAPYLQGEAWMQFDGRGEFVQLRGVDPALERRVSHIDDARFAELLDQLARAEEGIIAGNRLAADLNLAIGDRIAVTPLSSLTARRTDDARSFRVIGITDFGFYGNQNTALVHIDQGQNLFARDITAATVRYRLRVDDVFAASHISEQAAQLLVQPAEVSSWEQTQGSLFNALRMEKRMTGIMLMMIVIIGAVNIVSTLVMVVAGKSADIAILRTMGATRRTIMAIFMTQGVAAGVMGTLLGGALGVLLTRQMSNLTALFEGALNNWFYPDQVYMISHLRAELQWSDVVLVCTAALLVSFLATVYPAWRAARVQAAEVLRYE